MAFSNTFDSLSNAIIPQDVPVELIIDNHGVIINPNQGSYFYLDDIDENLNITLTNPTNSYCRTVYLRLSFEDDNLVINWPNNIEWYDGVTPTIYKPNKIFISLTTLDGGVTWYNQSLIKIKPLVNCSEYINNTYGIEAMTRFETLPSEIIEYVNSVRPTSLANFFSEHSNNYGCWYVTSLDLSNWDTSNVVSMRGTFYYCYYLSSLDLSNWDTSNVLDMSYLFDLCSNLISLDLSNWDTSKVTASDWMFYNCDNLQYLILNSSTVKFTKSDSLRSECKILVPSSALDTYKAHSAWSSRASQFDAIENYTIVKSNGTVTVTPNE